MTPIDLFTKNHLFTLDNYIITSLTYYYLGKGYDIDDIRIYTEPPEVYDQYPDLHFYVSICIEDEAVDSIYLDCNGNDLKGTDEEEITELTKTFNQFNDWFEKLSKRN